MVFGNCDTTSSARAALSLSALVLQNTALVFALKRSYDPSEDRYAPSTVVLVSESLKLLLCTLLAYTTPDSESLSTTFYAAGLRSC
mmetsp:Transcript_9473/g.42915  ORF Transcript_9473/g.42915 Transcript_9473/m.42915 type:complete len:86 (-) Transcript_9473:2653-2910(-)